MVGVNDYKMDDDDQIPTLKIDPEMERKQAGRLAATKAARDGSAVESALATLKAAAANEGENLMPPSWPRLVSGPLRARWSPPSRRSSGPSPSSPSSSRFSGRLTRVLGPYNRLKVQPSEADGWDVVNAEDGTGITNHPTRESAEEAAQIRAREDSISEETEGDVIVDTEHSHPIDDAEKGVKTAFFSLGGLLVLLAVLAIAIALIAALTGFGS